VARVEITRIMEVEAEPHPSTYFLNYFLLVLFLPLSSLPLFACLSLSNWTLRPTSVYPPHPRLLSPPQMPSPDPIWVQVKGGPSQRCHGSDSVDMCLMVG
jgi:hypothetical protein